MVAAKSLIRHELNRQVGQLVNIHRFVRGAEAIDGFVVGVGKKWVLLARDTDYTFDGFVCLRVADVERIRARPRQHSIAETSWTRRGDWPPGPPTYPIALDHTKELLDSLDAGDDPLLAIHVEYEDPDVLFLGALCAHSDGDFGLKEVTTDAVWDGTVSRWGHDELSRIDFASNYCQALTLAAGPRPEN